MSLQLIHSKIFELRGQRVMLDFDLAELYEVETKRINEQVKRNKERFPVDFMFKITVKEWNSIQSQIATGSQKHRGSAPYAFTEHGVTMLASVLRSKKAIDMNIAIVRAFIAIKELVNKHKDLHEQIHELRLEIQSRIGEHDVQLASIYDALENLLDKKEEENIIKQKWLERERIGFKK